MRCVIGRALVVALIPVLGIDWLVAQEPGRPTEPTVVRFTQPTESTSAPTEPARRERPSRALAARNLKPAAAVTPVATPLASQPVTVTIVADGREFAHDTIAERVDVVIGGVGVTLGTHDRVQPPADTRPADGMRIVVARAEVSQETRTEPLAFATVEQPQDDLPFGKRRAEQAGVEGVLEITEEVVRVEGAEQARTRVAERVVTASIDRVVGVGTALPPPPDPEPEPEPGLEPEPEPEVTAAPTPAPPSPEPSPTPTPTPAPAPSDSQEGPASWYNHPDEGLTAAHRTLPLGTVVTVTNLANGKQVQVTINDRGPFVGGRVIDLNRPAFAQVASLDDGVIQVRIEW